MLIKILMWLDRAELAFRLSSIELAEWKWDNLDSTFCQRLSFAVRSLKRNWK